MSLRLRLIVAFFLLSVVPLAAITIFAYTTNAKAVREAASHETELLAEELVQRMQLVTAQLSQRLEYIAELTALQDPETPVPAGATPTPPVSQSSNLAAATLSQVAMLLDNVEVVTRGGRGGRGGPNGGRGGSGGGRIGGPPPSTSPSGVPVVGEAQPQASQAPTNADGGRGGNRGRRQGFGRGQTDPNSGDPSGAPGVGPNGGANDGRGPTTSSAAVSSGAPVISGDPLANGQPVRIDLRPVRDEIMSQFGTPEELAKLTPDERRAIGEKVNQQMTSIERGIGIGTAEAQRLITEAQKAADAKAKETPASAPPTPTPSTSAAAPATSSTHRTTQFQGSRLTMRVERDKEVLTEVNAEVDLRKFLDTVFSTTRRDRGEVPFAVAVSGEVYTPNQADRQIITAISTDALKPAAEAGTTVLPSWVIVTSKDPSGSGLKFGIARPVGDSLNDLWRATARNAGLGLAFIGLALIGIVPLSGRLTKGLSILNEGVARIARGEYHTRVNVSSHDEIGRLATAFNHMAADVERHQNSAVEQERIRRELELGRQIQADMLPQSPLTLGLTEISGVSVPAKEVGGDFFNYFQLPSGDIAFLVGDVSGKGVGAALLMANIQASLRTRLSLGQDLASMAREVDADVEANTPGPVYATLFVGLLNQTTREFRFVNAGHHSQVILRPSGEIDLMASSGFPVGLLAGHGYTERKAQLHPGDVLFFYTDGCVEAENPADDMYGFERLEATLRAEVGKSASTLLAAVEQSVASFRGTQEPRDDATMMAVSIG